MIEKLKSMLSILPFKLSLLIVIESMIQSFPMSANFVFLSNDLGMEPSTITLYFTTIFIPTFFNAFYGLISDNVKIFGMRRKPYLVFSYLLTSLCYIFQSIYISTSSQMLFLGILMTVCNCMQIVVVNSIIVGLSKSNGEENGSSLQTWTYTLRTIGTIISTIISTLLLISLSVRYIIGLTSIFGFISFILALTLNEERDSKSCFINCNQAPILTIPKKLCYIDGYRDVLKQNFASAIFLFSYNLTPTSSDAYSSFLSNAYPDYYYSMFGLWGQFGALLATFLYYKKLKNINLAKIFFVATTFANLSGLTQIMVTRGAFLGMNEVVFISLDSMLVSFTSLISLLPVVILATNLSPVGLEGFAFSALISLYDLSAVFSGYLSAGLVHGLGITKSDFSNIWLLILICNLSNFLPLFLLCFFKLPSGSGSKEKKRASEGEEILINNEVSNHHVKGGEITEISFIDVKSVNSSFTLLDDERGSI